jgi:hypothetical protein
MGMIRRNALPIGLFFLAPFVAEFLLGNLPILFLPAIVVLAPMYGGGALLIRELVRRRALGWPNIVILAVAYGVLEEGLTTQSLFNPNYAGQRLLDEGFIPALGIGVPWTLFVVAIHVFWSICAPILLMEGFAGERRTTPWLGRRGLIWTAVLFVIGIALSTAINMSQWPYVSTPAQFAVTALIIVLLAAAGLLLRFGTPSRPGPAPRPWLVLVVTLVSGLIFEGITMVDAAPMWAEITVFLVNIALYLTLVRYWSARTGWGDAHRLAVAAGALVTYAWHSFVEQPVGGAALAVDLAGNTLCALFALYLLWRAWRHLRSTRP